MFTYVPTVRWVQGEEAATETTDMQLMLLSSLASMTATRAALEMVICRREKRSASLLAQLQRQERASQAQLQRQESELQSSQSALQSSRSELRSQAAHLDRVRAQLRGWVTQPAVIHNLRASIAAGKFADQPVALALVDCIAAHSCKQGDGERHGWRYTPSADLRLPPECLKDFNIAMLSVCKPRGFELFAGNTLGALTRTVKGWRGPLRMETELSRGRVESAAFYFRAAGFLQHTTPPSAAPPTTLEAPLCTPPTEPPPPSAPPSPRGSDDEGEEGAEAGGGPGEGFVPAALQREGRGSRSSAAQVQVAATDCHTTAAASRTAQQRPQPSRAAAAAALAEKLRSLPPEEAPFSEASAASFRIALTSEATRLYPSVRIMDETRLAQAVLRDHTPEKRLHGFSAMPRIVLIEFVPLATTCEDVCAWLAPLEVQRRQGKLELHWCRASDEDEGVEFTTVAEVALAPLACPPAHVAWAAKIRTRISCQIRAPYVPSPPSSPGCLADGVGGCVQVVPRPAG